jgi:hypothetical protein
VRCLNSIAPMTGNQGWLTQARAAGPFHAMSSSSTYRFGGMNHAGILPEFVVDLDRRRIRPDGHKIAALMHRLKVVSADMDRPADHSCPFARASRSTFSTRSL